MDGASILEDSTKTLNFKEGFGWSATSSEGTTKNIDSDTWNFVWKGASNGTFYRGYTYGITVKDTGGNELSNVTIELLDVFGNTAFNDTTNSSGTMINEQTFTLIKYDNSTGSIGESQSPYRIYIKKYGYKFVELEKILTGKTSEETALETDSFKVLSETDALNIANVSFIAPIKIPYGQESNSSVTTSMALAYPPSNSEYFALFRDGTRMYSGTDYSLECSTGVITFLASEAGNNITAVYSYNANVTLLNGMSDTRTISEIYDFLKASLSLGFNTLDGAAYTSDMDLIIGNDTTTGSMGSPDKSLTYTCGRSTDFGSAGGYLDLLGTTVGGALSINSETGSFYNPGEQVDVYAIILDSDSRLVSASVIAKAYYPNESLLSIGSATELSTGRFKYSFTLPTTATEGTYRIDLDATYLAGEVHDTVIFLLENALNIESSVGSSYSPSDEVIAHITTTDSEGTLINSTVEVSTYYPNGSSLNSGSATQNDTGTFRYNFTAPETEGTYEVRINATYQGDESYDVVSFQITAEANQSSPEVTVTAPSIVSANTSFGITTLTESNLGVAADCDSDATITIRDLLLGTDIVTSASMTNFGTGQYNYTWSSENESSYLATVSCTMSAISYTGTAPFSTLNVPVEDGFSVYISDTGEVSVGDAYTAKVWIYDNLGTPIDADTIPIITLIDPENNSIITGATMTKLDTGIYTYLFSTTGYTAGNWETIANVTVNGVTASPSEIWELESTYADVSNPAITDNTIPTITATTYISNNGTAGSDFEIVYCIVDAPENVCGGVDDVDIAAITEYFEAKELRLVNLNGLEVSTIGDYYFRVQARPISATETATGVSSFTATTGVNISCGDGTCNGDETCSTCPGDCGACVVSPGGGGGGSGGGGITPSVIDEVEEVPQEPYVLGIDVGILSKYKEVFAGNDIAAKVIIQSLGTIEDVEDVEIEYFIEDSEGKIIDSKEETIDIQKTAEILAELTIPEKTKVGEYWFVAKANYQNKGAIDRESFNVIKKEVPLGKDCCLVGICWFNYGVCWYWWILIVIIAILVIKYSVNIQIIKRKTPRTYKTRTIRSLKELENLHKRKKVIENTHKKHKARIIKHLISRKHKVSRKKEDLNKLINYIKGGV